MASCDESFEKLLKYEKILKKSSEILRVLPEDFPRVLKRFLREIEEMECEIKRLKNSLQGEEGEKEGEERD